MRKFFLPKSTCKYCSAQVPEGKVFCSFCGRDRFLGTKQWEYLFGGTSIVGILIIIVCFAVILIGTISAFLSTSSKRQISSTGSPTSTLVPTQFYQAPSSSSTIQPTLQPIPTVTPNPGLPPTSDPEQFIREYFAAVWQVRNYEYLWSLSTSSFQANASPGGYQEYTSWWGSVDHVDVLSVNVTSNDGQYASVDVHVTIYLKGGTTLTNRNYLYDLIYDSNRQIWMFDYR
jgi:hypothetical protein